MYLEFFGLQRRPFILTPDPDFLYMSRVHDLALTHLEYGVIHNIGFLALTGDVGAGKTTLLKYLFEKIRDSVDIAMIMNTNLTPQALLEMLVKEYELDCPGREKTELFDRLSEHFIMRYSQGRRCVIMVDEAQNLPDETFEELRMLSNLEVGSDFLLQIILVGQPQLRNRLAEPSLEQLAQRISVYYHLTGLPEEEVKNYIEHRLSVAGHSPGDSKTQSIFQDGAISLVHQYSRGIPRLINSICDAALTYAFAEDQHQVTPETIEQVVKDNELLRLRYGQESAGTSDTEQVQTGQQTDLSMRAGTSMADTAGIESMFASLSGKLELMETRLLRLEEIRQDRAVQVLQQMLEQEREKNRVLEKKLTALALKYRLREKELNRPVALQKDQDPENGKNRTVKTEYRRFWNVFTGKK